MRVAVAVIAGLVIFFLGFSVIRGFAGPRRGVATGPLTLEATKPIPEGVRILYWCETCGMEALLLRAGSEAPPKHCGEPMTRREEITRG
jgi:hypothetical protein